MISNSGVGVKPYASAIKSTTTKFTYNSHTDLILGILDFK